MAPNTEISNSNAGSDSLRLLSAMRQAAGEACATLGALAHENRLMLLCQLCSGEKCVGELEVALDLHPPTLSQQLAVLRNEGLVATRRDGQRIYYSIADERVAALIGAIHNLYCNKEEMKAP